MSKQASHPLGESPALPQVRRRHEKAGHRPGVLLGLIELCCLEINPKFEKERLPREINQMAGAEASPTDFSIVYMYAAGS
jgi:hypothetical protein